MFFWMKSWNRCVFNWRIWMCAQTTNRFRNKKVERWICAKLHRKGDENFEKFWLPNASMNVFNFLICFTTFIGLSRSEIWFGIRLRILKILRVLCSIEFRPLNDEIGFWPTSWILTLNISPICLENSVWFESYSWLNSNFVFKISGFRHPSVK